MNPTHNTDEARRYSRTIAEEVKALDTLIAADPDNDADQIADALATLELEHIDDTSDALSTYLNETALDVTYYQAAGHDDEPLTRVVILRTCGGPRCEITRDSNDGNQIEVTTYVDNDSYTYRATAPYLAAALDEIASYQ
jgi:hypothetical protein